MDLTIEQSCPSCGAAIELHEDDRLIRCGFCDVINYMLGKRVRRFVLPWSLPSHIAESDLFFVPYLRFKGAIHYTAGARLEYKLVDATRLAIANSKLPASLRLRPQAMKVRLIVADIEGQFLAQTIETNTIFTHAAKISTLFSTDQEDEILNRAFIGESLSRIYQPYYIQDEKLFDAVDNVQLGPESLIGSHKKNSSAAKSSWEPRFISTICPKCGDILEGERDCLVLHCTNCETMWQEKTGSFSQLKWKVVQSKNSSARYLPFWKISFQTTGKVLKSFGDFLRLTNQPVVVRKEHDDTQLAFWLPAFKVHPKAFLQLASKLTVTQLRIPQGIKKGKVVNGYPVNLHWREAFQSVKSVLAATSLNKKKIYPLLPEITIASASYSLVYLPFSGHSHDLIQEHTPVTVLTAALKYGRKL